MSMSNCETDKRTTSSISFAYFFFGRKHLIHSNHLNRKQKLFDTLTLSIRFDLGNKRSSSNVVLATMFYVLLPTCLWLRIFFFSNIKTIWNYYIGKLSGLMFITCGSFAASIATANVYVSFFHFLILYSCKYLRNSTIRFSYKRHR